MATIKKTLQGAVKIPATSDTYVLELPTTNFPPSPGTNPLDLFAIEEVWIEVGEVGVAPTGLTTIQLPPIQYFNGGWNPKIYITHVNQTLGSVLIPTPADPGATPPIVEGFINGNGSLAMTENGQSALVKITNDNNYAVWVTPIVAP